jgi:hypothetical protein
MRDQTHLLIFQQMLIQGARSPPARLKSSSARLDRGPRDGQAQGAQIECIEEQASVDTWR